MIIPANASSDDFEESSRRPPPPPSTPTPPPPPPSPKPSTSKACRQTDDALGRKRLYRQYIIQLKSYGITDEMISNKK